MGGPRGRAAGRQHEELRGLTRRADRVEADLRQRRFAGARALAAAQRAGTLDHPIPGLPVRRPSVLAFEKSTILRVETPGGGRIRDRRHGDPFRVVPQIPPDELRGVLARAGLGAQRGECPGCVERGGGLPAVQGGGEDPGEEIERKRMARVVAFAQFALDPGKRAVYLGLVEPVAGGVGDGRQHPRFDLPGEVRIASVDAALEDDPAAGHLYPVRRERRRRAPRRFQRPAKRRVPLLQQAAREKPRADHRHRIRGVPEPPRKRHARVRSSSIRHVRHAHRGVAHHGSGRRFQRWHFKRRGKRRRGGRSVVRKPRERERLQPGVQPLRPQGPGAQEHRVAGVVVAPVVGPQRLVIEGRDPPGIAAGVEAVRPGREQAAVQRLPELLFGIVHEAAHLAQHHAAPHRRFALLPRGLDLDAASFLLEVQPVEAREEGRVEIDRQQVLVVGEAPGGEVAGGAVLGGQRVHRRAQGAAQHREERAPAGVALAAAHDQMFEDVGEAARIRGGREEGHQEGAVLGGQIEVQVAGPGGEVDVARERAVERGQGGTAPMLEARPCRAVAGDGVRRGRHGRLSPLSAAAARCRASGSGSAGPSGRRRGAAPPPRRCRRSRAGRA